MTVNDFKLKLNKIKFNRILIVLSFLVFALLISIYWLGNPFSSYEHYDLNDEMYIYRPLKIEDINGSTEDEWAYDKESLKKHQDDIQEAQHKIDVDKTKKCNAGQVSVIIEDEEGEYSECRSIDQYLYTRVHPLPLGYLDDNNNRFLLGTTHNVHTAYGMANEIGYDRLSYLSQCFSKTINKIFLSVITFLFFGIYFGIMLGYYNQRFKIINGINNFIVKSLESIPILLLLIISIVIISALYPDAAPSYIFYILFGFFASPALANLIIQKFKQLNDEDFVVALKLLGLSDQRIIFSHILRYYCLGIILAQTSYIAAHAFFLDITLSFTPIASNKTASLGYFIKSSFDLQRVSDVLKIDFLICLTISFLLVKFFYSIQNLNKNYE